MRSLRKYNTSSSKQTKEWRRRQSWYVNGKKNECEKHQISYMTSIFGKLSMTDERIHLPTGKIQSVKYPFKRTDAFDWSENFDGKIEKNSTNLPGTTGKNIYFNFKFVSASGGAQTRSLREVYHFIEKQPISPDNIYINILDGDESNRKMKFFCKHRSLTKYIGDSYSFLEWHAVITLDIPNYAKKRNNVLFV